MRTMLLASASVLLIGGTALAQNSGSPLSTSASHISAADTRGQIAPRLPVSAEDASATEFLTHAQTALRRGRSGEAQESLERAETRLLSRSTAPSQASVADNSPRVASIREARQDLGHGDKAGAMRAIEAALSMPGASMGMNQPSNGMPSNGTPMMSNGAMNQPPMAPNGVLMAPGIAGDGGTGAGTRLHPQASSSASPSVPPNSLGGIATGIGGDNGTGVGTQSRPQASFSGPSPSNAVPPGSAGGIANGIGADNGTGVGSQSRPQAGFSGPGATGEVVPSPSGNAGAVQTP